MVPKITPHRLKKYRRILGYSQVGAARLLGVSPTELMLWEKGRRIPQIENLMKLEALYQRLISHLYAEVREKAIAEIEKNKMLYGEFGTGPPP